MNETMPCLSGGPKMLELIEEDNRGIVGPFEVDNPTHVEWCRIYRRRSVRIIGSVGPEQQPKGPEILHLYDERVGLGMKNCSIDSKNGSKDDKENYKSV